MCWNVLEWNRMKQNGMSESGSGVEQDKNVEKRMLTSKVRRRVGDGMPTCALKCSEMPGRSLAQLFKITENRETFKPSKR